MNGAPKVQALRENDSYTSQDEKSVEEWTSSLKWGGGADEYHRDISCADLIKKGKEVKLSFQIDSNDAVASAPIRSRLSRRYAEEHLSVIETELPPMHLPLSLVAMRAISKNSCLARVFKP